MVSVLAGFLFDRLGTSGYHVHHVLLVLEIIETYSYVDSFRELHEDLYIYSWRKKILLKQSRLDFLTSESLLSSLESCSIESRYRSGHSAMSLSLKFIEFKKGGRGLWKINNSLLYDDKYLECIRDSILQCKKQYAVPIYNFANIHTVSSEYIFFNINN